VRRIHAVLRRALQQALRWGWLTTNPAALATLPKITAAEIVAPSSADVARLLALAATEDLDFHCYLRLAASTGAQRSQMCGLQWRDLDLDGRSILFARGVVDGPDGVEIVTSGFVFSYEADASRPWRPDGVTNRFGRLRRKGVT
jgi:integrase